MFDIYHIAFIVNRIKIMISTVLIGLIKYFTLSKVCILSSFLLESTYTYTATGRNNKKGKIIF